MMNRIAIGTSALLIALAGGCTGTGNTSAIRAVDGLVSGREPIGGNQDVLLSLHSLSVEPGAVLRLPSNGRRSTTSAIIEHTDQPHSYLRIETFEKHLTHDDMASIRTAADDITALISQQLDDQIKLYKTQNTASTVSQQVQQATDANTDAANLKAKADQEVKAAEAKLKAASDKATKLQTSRSEILQSRNAAQAGLMGLLESSPNAQSLRAALADHIDALKQIGASLAASQKEIEAAQAEKAKAEAAAADAAQRLAVTQKALDAAKGTASSTDKARTEAQAKADKGGSDLSSRQKQLIAALSEPNVVVFRWNDEGSTQSSGSGSGSWLGRITGSGEVSQEATKKQSGYAVLNGFRRIRLVVGEDFRTTTGSEAVDALNDLSKAAGLQGGQGVIVTSIIQTRELMYLTAEDLDELFRAKLDAAVSKTAADLSASQKAEISAKFLFESRALRSLQNNGYFTSPTNEMKAIEWDKLRSNPSHFLPPPSEPASPNESWITIHAVTATLAEIMAQRVSP